MTGYIQVYTGNGKGKTTAAIGLAMRSAGAGLRVFFAQFVKGMKYSELHSLSKLNGQIVVKQYGRDNFIHDAPSKEDIEEAKKGFEEVKQIISGGDFDVIILDEIFIALFFKLISETELIDFIKHRPQNVELVMTGRYAPQSIIELADLVTDMHEVKHYYQNGVLARDGIEK